MPCVTFAPALNTIAETIQTAIAPVFLLAGIGSFLNVLTGRLSRVIDRARALEALHPQSTGPAHDRHVWELKRLDRRMRVINRALMATVTSAVAICLVVALLFVAELGQFRIGREIAGVFIFAMAALTTGFVGFMIEVQLSLRATSVRRELLEDAAR
jgi:hypothetical protein